MNIYERLYRRLFSVAEEFQRACRNSTKYGDGKIPDDGYAELCEGMDFLANVEELLRPIEGDSTADSSETQ